MSKNHYFITDGDPVVLGWSRDEKGNVVNRHPVKVANALTVAKRHTTQNYVLVKTATKDGFSKLENGGVRDLSYPNSKSRRGRVQGGGSIAPTITAKSENGLRRIEWDEPTIEQRGHGYVKGNKYRDCPTITGQTFTYNNLLNNGIRIRKLTERECFRLMGVSEENIDKIQSAGISRSRQGVLAGNSIVVDTLAAIFRKLFIDTEITELTLF